MSDDHSTPESSSSTAAPPASAAAATSAASAAPAASTTPAAADHAAAPQTSPAHTLVITGFPPTMSEGELSFMLSANLGAVRHCRMHQAPNGIIYAIVSFVLASDAASALQMRSVQIKAVTLVFRALAETGLKPQPASDTLHHDALATRPPPAVLLTSANVGNRRAAPSDLYDDGFGAGAYANMGMNIDQQSFAMLNPAQAAAAAAAAYPTSYAPAMSSSYGLHLTVNPVTGLPVYANLPPAEAAPVHPFGGPVTYDPALLYGEAYVNGPGGYVDPMTGLPAAPAASLNAAGLSHYTTSLLSTASGFADASGNHFAGHSALAGNFGPHYASVPPALAHRRDNLSDADYYGMLSGRDGTQLRSPGPQYYYDDGSLHQPPGPPRYRDPHYNHGRNFHRGGRGGNRWNNRSPSGRDGRFPSAAGPATNYAQTASGHHHQHSSYPSSNADAARYASPPHHQSQQQPTIPSSASSSVVAASAAASDMALQNINDRQQAPAPSQEAALPHAPKVANIVGPFARESSESKTVRDVPISSAAAQKDASVSGQGAGSRSSEPASQTDISERGPVTESPADYSPTANNRPKPLMSVGLEDDDGLGSMYSSGSASMNDTDVGTPVSSRGLLVNRNDLLAAAAAAVAGAAKPVSAAVSSFTAAAAVAGAAGSSPLTASTVVGEAGQRNRNAEVDNNRMASAHGTASSDQGTDTAASTKHSSDNAAASGSKGNVGRSGAAATDQAVASGEAATGTTRAVSKSLLADGKSVQQVLEEHSVEVYFLQLDLDKLSVAQVCQELKLPAHCHAPDGSLRFVNSKLRHLYSDGPLAAGVLAELNLHVEEDEDFNNSVFSGQESVSSEGQMHSTGEKRIEDRKARVSATAVKSPSSSTAPLLFRVDETYKIFTPTWVRR